MLGSAGSHGCVLNKTAEGSSVINVTHLHGRKLSSAIETKPKETRCSLVPGSIRRVRLSRWTSGEPSVLRGPVVGSGLMGCPACPEA